MFLKLWKSMCALPCRIVCTTEEIGVETLGHVSVEVTGIGSGLSSQTFSYQVRYILQWPGSFSLGPFNTFNVGPETFSSVLNCTMFCVFGQNPVLEGVSPQRGPQAGGTSLTITGKKLLTGRASDISVLLGDIPCAM